MQKSLEFSRVSYTQYEALYAVSTRSVSASQARRAPQRGIGEGERTTTRTRTKRLVSEKPSKCASVFAPRIDRLSYAWDLN
jgi:hypothetical protein